MDNTIIVAVLTGIFIYNRKIDYYKIMPRKNIIAAILVAVWTYITFRYSMWFVILGLIILKLFDGYLA